MTRLMGFISAVAFAVSAVACGQTDPGITTSVKARFAQDDLVKAHEINVTTEDSVVRLTGEVETMTVKQQALRLARETEGVRDVIDELRVEAAATSGDLDDDLDIDIDVDADLERGARETGKAIREGAEEIADAARKTGKAARDAVTDEDRDTDKDGK